MAKVVNKPDNSTKDKTVESLPSNTENLNTDEAIKVDQQVLEKVPLILPVESEYTSDVTSKKEE